MKKIYIAPFVTKVLFEGKQIVAASVTKIGGDVNTELTFSSEEPTPEIEADVKGTIFDDEDPWAFEY